MNRKVNVFARTCENGKQRSLTVKWTGNSTAQPTIKDGFVAYITELGHGKKHPPTIKAERAEMGEIICTAAVNTWRA